MIGLILYFVAVIVAAVLFISIAAMGWASFQGAPARNRGLQIASLLVCAIFSIIFIMCATVLVSMSRSVASTFMSLKLISL